MVKWNILECVFLFPKNKKDLYAIFKKKAAGRNTLLPFSLAEKQ